MQLSTNESPIGQSRAVWQVFYEIGIAHTIGKPMILITQNQEDIPSDLRHIRYIQYAYTKAGLMKLENNHKNYCGNNKRYGQDHIVSVAKSMPPNNACSELGCGPRKKTDPGEEFFPFRRLVLPPSR